MSPKSILNYLVFFCALAVLQTLANGQELEKLMLTEFITSGKLKEAKEAATVNWRSESLDSVPSYSGFITVNGTTNSSMFFWFIPSVYEEPETAPLMLWLNGGPGESSMFGLFNENGPFKIKKRGRIPRLVLRLRKDTWARKHSMLFIDNPIGTGFSFTDSEDGYAKTQEDVSRDLYNALGQFFQIFPEFSKPEFYIAGESYAGKYVPHLAMKIHEENKVENAKKINLAGVITGGPFTDPLSMTSGFSDYYFNLGLIDEHGLAHFKEQESLTRKLIEEQNHDEAIRVNDNLLSEVFTDHPSYFSNQTGFEFLNSALDSKPSKKLAYYTRYLEQKGVRKIIHVGDQQFNNMSTKVQQYLKADLFKSCKSEMEELINLKYKVLVYVGQFDLITPHVAVSKFIQSMNFDEKSEYEKSDRRIVRATKGDVAGYVKSAGKFYYVVVRNAGHFVPRDQPRWSREIIERFISEKGKL